MDLTIHLDNRNKLTFNKPEKWNNLLLCSKIKYYSTILDHNYSIYVDKICAKEIVTHLTNEVIKTAKIIKVLTKTTKIFLSSFFLTIRVSSVKSFSTILFSNSLFVFSSSSNSFSILLTYQFKIIYSSS